MSDVQQPDISGIIAAAKAQSPSDFQSAFNSLMLDKIATAVELKKAEVAQSFFKTDDETSATDEQEENPDENIEASAGSETSEA